MPIVSAFPMSDVLRHNLSDTAHADIRSAMNNLIVMLFNNVLMTEMTTTTGENLTTATGNTIVAHKPMN